MLLCTFFGDGDINESIRQKLRQCLIDLIENHNVDLFYVGNEGEFNTAVTEELKKLEHVYSHIYYEIIICNIPYRKYSAYEVFSRNLMVINGEEEETKEHGMEVIKKWLICASDYIVSCVKNSEGDAHKFKKLAEIKEKKVIELYE